MVFYVRRAREWSIYEIVAYFLAEVILDGIYSICRQNFRIAQFDLVVVLMAHPVKTVVWYIFSEKLMLYRTF